MDLRESQSIESCPFLIEVSSIVSKKSYVTDRWVATAYLVEKEQLTATG